MVRRASHIPPNSKSLEEVVLGRIANTNRDDANPRRSTKPASSVPTARKATKVPSTDTSGWLPPASTSATLDRIGSMATDVAQLNEKLQSAAIQDTRQRSARSVGDSPDRVHHRDQIEQYIKQSHDEIYAAYSQRKVDTTLAPTKAGLRAAYDPAKGAQVNHAVRELRSTVRRLDKVFYEVATGDKQRHMAATKISTLVRGFITRRRYRRMRYALGQWRARKCTGLLLHLEQFSAREEFLRKQIEQLHIERMHSLLRRVIAEIRDIALMNLPLRRRRLEEVARRFQDKQWTLVKTVHLVWKQSALGPRSRKKATVDAKLRHAAARQRLDALQRFDVITTEMVHEEFLKENIRIVRAKHPHYVLKTYFQLLLQHEYLPMKQKSVRAVVYARKKLLTLVWHAWLPLFRAAQVDKAIASVNERRTLERFNKHHNLRKIDAHYRRTHARKHLRAWALYNQRIRRVRRLFEDNTKANLTQILQRWHVRARYQRELRAHAVEAWRAYSRRIFQTPFRAWYTYTASRRADRQAKESICVAYQRRQRRHTKYTFFRLWKHQILFGNIEGIHSKIDLLRSLEDQKRLCLGHEANAKLYQQNIAALQQVIAQLEARLTDKQLELIQLHDATQATRFSVHSAEQSIARVQGMLEAVRQVHPGTLTRIEKMFAENPLLTQDLHDVVAMHVAKRQQVMAKIALDDAELEIQNATDAVGKVMNREDQLLLHRVKWVLSRLDLQQHHHREHGPSQQPMDQLCALLEFMRHGETGALSTHNDPSHPRDGVAARADKPMSKAEATVVVDRRALAESGESWHSFMEALTVKFAPERMLQVKERLVKRAAEMSERLDEYKTNLHIYNAYR